MKTLKIFLLLTLGVGNYSVVAQENLKTATKFLQTGDQIPNLPLGDMVNYYGKEKSLGDFKGKLLILDFWATWCSPCIGAFPGNDKMRQLFGDSIAIIPITYEDQIKAAQLLKNIEEDKKTRPLFSVVNDKAIRALFNFKTIPHYVWIDQSGRIIKQTTDEEVTEVKIRAALRGNNAILISKDTVTKSRNIKSPLFNMGVNLKKGNISFSEPLEDSILVIRSALTKSIGNLAGAQSYRPNRFTAVNTTIQWLYKLTLGKINMKQRHEFAMYMADNRVIWDLKDNELNVIRNAPTKTSEYIKWIKKYGYCYEIVTPSYILEKEMYEIALRDINLHFQKMYGITGTIEKKRVECLVLERTENTNSLFSHQTNTKGVINESKYRFHISNTRFDYFLQRFASYYLQLITTPIVDETHINASDLVNMDIQCNLADEDAVNMELKKYGLRFRKDYREIDMVIIKQISKPQLNLL